MGVTQLGRQQLCLAATREDFGTSHYQVQQRAEVRDEETTFGSQASICPLDIHSGHSFSKGIERPGGKKFALLI